MWNEMSCNPYYEKFLRDKESKRLKRSLTQMRPLLELAKPKKPLKIDSKTKKTRLIIESVQQIEVSNQILLKKMLDINKAPSSLNKINVMPRKTSSGSLNMKKRIEIQNKIMVENKKILEKLQSTQSFYSAEKWENDFQFHKWLKNTHSKSFFKCPKRIDPVIDEKSYCEKLGISSINPADFYEVKSNFFKNYSFAG